MFTRITPTENIETFINNLKTIEQPSPNLQEVIRGLNAIVEQRRLDAIEIAKRRLDTIGHP